MRSVLVSTALFAVPVTAFVSHQRFPSSSGVIKGRRSVGVQASVEVLEASQHLHHLVTGAQSALMHPHFGSIDVSLTLADISDAIETSAKEALSNIDPRTGLEIDPKTYCPTCAVEDKGWFGTGVGKGFHPWGAWRGFVQSSIVNLHEFLVDKCGVTENSYGLAIMLFTFGLRSITLPLTYLQFAATERTKAMQPIMTEIKERFPDQDMQNRVIAKLYEDTDTNPLAGCLPPLLQIPVFIALYRSILNLANAKALEEPFFFLPSLEGPTLTDKLQLPQGRGIQWLTEGWEGAYSDGDLVPFLGWEDTIAYCAFPVIIALGQAASLKLTTPEVDPNAEGAESLQRTQAILKYLPFMIGFFSLQVPAALCLYWFTSNTFTTAATLSIKAYFAANPPVVDWDFLKDAPPKSQFQLEAPANMEEAIADARLNARPPRVSRKLLLSSQELSVEAVLAAEA